MSIVKFELTEQHIKLAQHIELEELLKYIIKVKENNEYFDNDFVEIVGVILFGRPKNFDPLNENPFDWSDEELGEIGNVLLGLPTAIDVILNAKTFKPGIYKTKYHDRNWKHVD